jgi:hypothetical protein
MLLGRLPSVRASSAPSAVACASVSACSSWAWEPTGSVTWESAGPSGFFCVFRRSKRYSASRIPRTAWRTFQDTEREFTLVSTRNNAASLASRSFSAFAAPRTDSRNAFSENSLRSPIPTSSTRSAATPGRPRKSSVEPVFPARSPSVFFSAPRAA